MAALLGLWNRKYGAGVVGDSKEVAGGLRMDFMGSNAGSNACNYAMGDSLAVERLNWPVFFGQVNGDFHLIELRGK